jgi:hypothetical protein
MIHCFIFWNAPFVENYLLFSNVTDTTIHSNTCIHNPYDDEVNENWPFLKNNFDKAQYELIVEKKIIGDELIGWNTSNNTSMLFLIYMPINVMYSACLHQICYQ